MGFPMTWTVVSRYCSLLLQFAVLLWLARELPSADYGAYLLILSVVMPVYFVIGGGVSETFVREHSSLQGAQASGARSTAASGVYAALVIWVVLLCVLAGMAMIFGLWSGAPSVLIFGLVYLVALGVMFNCSQVLLAAGWGRWAGFFYYPAVNLCLGLAYLVLGATASRIEFLQVAISGSITLVLLSLTAAALAWVVSKPSGRGWGEASRMMRRGVGLSVARGLYTSGQWLPTLFVGLFVSATQAGIYGTAGRLAVAVAALTAAVRFSVRPALVRGIAANDMSQVRHVVGSLARWTALLAFAALLLCVQWGDQLIRLSFGIEFGAAAEVLCVLLVGVFVEALFGPIDEILKMAGFENRVNALLASALVVYFVILWVALASGLSSVLVVALIQTCYMSAVTLSMVFMTKRLMGIWVYPTVPTRGLLDMRNRLRAPK